jgi:hypothetical protein
MKAELNIFHLFALVVGTVLFTMLIMDNAINRSVHEAFSDGYSRGYNFAKYQESAPCPVIDWSLYR